MFIYPKLVTFSPCKAVTPPGISQRRQLYRGQVTSFRRPSTPRILEEERASSSEMEEVFPERAFYRLKPFPSSGCAALLLLVLWRGLPESDAAPMVEGTNLALGGKANQSSTFEAAGVASKAIDGSLESNYLLGQCSHTDSNYEPWWAVDLLDMYPVSFVAITNRGDDVSERINGAEIEVWGAWFSLRSRCAHITTMAAGETRFFPCGGIKGRFVAVIIPGRTEYLTLCEVQVFTLPLPGFNVALHGIASQASTLDSIGVASKAIDGNLESNYLQGHCSSTSYSYQPWWAVDLLDTYPVSFVAITNRGADVSERINGAEIQIWDTWFSIRSRCDLITSLGAGETRFFPCGGTEGRYVAVIIHGWSEYLSLCEVQVFTLHLPVQRQALRLVFTSAEGNALETPETRELILRKFRVQIETQLSVNTFNLSWGVYQTQQQDLRKKEETRTQSCLGV
ncbi:uncharacterized protein LOC115080311 [Rhinatrema bivittatum]|uniref:uncharacterized protein LOC115080311 n=1 Tax=Rhinatrema bivittatum TaxID=194408 RepID=UPI0011285ED2|nr:uncharacterized protein LOC115080311 [Rhinatrema bivittatum]